MEPWDEPDQQAMYEQQTRDREQIEVELADVIRHAQQLGLPEQEVTLLRWGCGI